MQEEQTHPTSIPPRITHQDLKRIKDGEEKRRRRGGGGVALNMHTNSCHEVIRLQSRKHRAHTKNVDGWQQQRGCGGSRGEKGRMDKHKEKVRRGKGKKGGLKIYIEKQMPREKELIV